MSILSNKALVVARTLVNSGPGEAARQVRQAAAEEVRRFKEAVLQEVIGLSLDRALGPARRRQKPETPIPWPCPACGQRSACQVMRNGNYRRRPLTQEGPIDIQIPQLLCRDCGKAVPFFLPCLPRWRRLWHDVEHELVRAYLNGHSYRTIALQVAGSLGLMTAWRAVQRVAEGQHRPPPTPKLEALGLDELHVRIRGKAAWFLTARGKIPTGGHYLGAVLAEDRSQKAWELALDALRVGQLPPEPPVIADGDQAIEAAVGQCLPSRRLQRCAWHVLHNVASWLEERLPGQERLPTRRAYLAAAQAVVNAPTPKERHASLSVLAEAVPWLARDLARALRRVSYPSKGPRTNNVCERGFREWRRRTRPMDGFGSWQGARNFATLWMLKENARATGQDWMEVIMP